MDPKEHIRQLVGAALAAVLQQQSADATVAALARSLQANRAPKVKCAVMEFFAAAAMAGPEGPAAQAGSSCNSNGSASLQVGAGEELQPAPLLAQLTGSAALPGLLRSLLQLATDKNPDVRRAAADAVAAAYHGGEAQAVLAAIHALPPADMLAVQRAVSPAIQQQGSGSASASAAMSLVQLPLSRAGSRAASLPSGSRRQSGEGLKQQPASDNSGSLTARSRQGSQQAVAVEAAALGPPPAPAQQQEQQQQAAAAQTPEPPSPFAWRSESASPSLARPVLSERQPQAGAADAEGQLQPAPPMVLATAAALPQQQALTAAPATAPARQWAAGQPADVQAQAADLAPFDDVMAGQLQRLVGLLQQGPSSEALQGLSRLAHVLPAAAWPPCFDQVGGVCGGLWVQ